MRPEESMTEPEALMTYDRPNPFVWKFSLIWVGGVALLLWVFGSLLF